MKKVLATQLYLTICNPMDCSLPGSSVHGSLQARILVWVAMLSFRRSSQPRDQTLFSHISSIPFLLSYLLHFQIGSLPQATPGKPLYIYIFMLSTNDDSFTSSSKFECFPFPLPKRYGYD